MKKNMLKLLILLFSFALTQSCVKMTKEGYYNGYETPLYKVVEQYQNIEIRKYKSNLVAEVKVEGDREEAVKEGFKILARYIFGKNATKEKVAMTSPVSQEKIIQGKSEKIAMTSPVSQIEESQGGWIIQFTMPSKYKIDNLPKPKDDKIKFKVQEEKKVVAIRFSGIWSDKRFNEEKSKLEKFITEKNLKTKTSSPIILYYDDPFTFPWNRRNEVVWEIK